MNKFRESFRELFEKVMPVFGVSSGVHAERRVSSEIT